MRGIVAVTEYEWYDFLRQEQHLEEVNFWRPSAHQAAKAEPGTPFLFKLKAPHKAICGFGHFVKYTALPDWLAWQWFDRANGCASLADMQRRIQKIRRSIDFKGDVRAEYIGCLLIAEPVLFPPEQWIPQPKDWPPQNLTVKYYDLEHGEGQRVWLECLARASKLLANRAAPPVLVAAAQPGLFGSPYLTYPRLGQGTFRAVVTDAYGRACSVTGEHSLPALEAAHIRRFSDQGPHDVRNGVLLRADLHRLFDQGYVTITPEYRLEVSSRLREEYQNGHTYYPLHGNEVRLPKAFGERPSPEFLDWHSRNVFR